MYIMSKLLNISMDLRELHVNVGLCEDLLVRPGREAYTRGAVSNFCIIQYLNLYLVSSLTLFRVPTTLLLFVYFFKSFIT